MKNDSQPNDPYSEIHQNTPEWLQMRKRFIGASDAPVIMGSSPWKTPYRLFQEKLDLIPSIAPTESMKRGLNLEEAARQKLEEMTGLFFLPQVKIHASISYMMASLDAIDPENKYIAEIKCPNKEDHAIALNGNIPGKYFPQLQHQLEVCGLDMAYYFSFNGTEGAVVKVYRNDQYIKNMIDKERVFWECMQECRFPEMTERDYEKQESQSWINTATQWLAVSEQIKSLEREEKELREVLVHMANNKNAIGGNIRLTRALRKGSVEYSQIPELKCIDLEQYRKSPTEYFRISRI